VGCLRDLGMLEHLARALRLLDRQVRRRRRAGPDAAVRDEARQPREEEEQTRGDQEALPYPLEEVVQAPRQ
jgi:hypothetical protein